MMTTLVLSAAILFAATQPQPFPDTAEVDELGFRPAENETVAINPAPLSWASIPKCRLYELELSQKETFRGKKTIYRTNTVFTAHCPDRVLAPGTWYWRVRGVFVRKSGKHVPTAWSRTRSFKVPKKGAVEMPMPPLADLFARIPSTHPRLFMRPEQLAEYRANLKGKYAQVFDLLKQNLEVYDQKLAAPPVEPLRFQANENRKNDAETKAWRDRWWGNRLYVIDYLGGAAQYGFYWRLTGDRAVGEKGKAILMTCASWDPKGATGYRYNDEVGMPFFSRFARAYSFLNDLLTEEERATCRAMMKIRGEEMYRHLCPRLLNRPYASHSNRAWHFLAEGAVAFWGEIPEAEKWLAFAMEVFYAAYPVWGDEDGAWHEGLDYWSSYMQRFFWWADVLQNTFGINPFQKPYFSRMGDFALYQLPPGARGFGFGDRAEHPNWSVVGMRLLRTLLRYMENPYWRWYTDLAQQEIPFTEDPYIEFLRVDGRPQPAKPPTDIPQSKLFRGVGLAAFNTDLTAASNNVQVLFKSNPTLGLFSHGYDPNNSFLLSVYGEPIFIHGGVRDCFGSPFHTNYMWHVKGNCTAAPTGDTQRRQQMTSRGEITEFETTPKIDRVTGVTGDIWENRKCRRHERQILFNKTGSGQILIIDRFEADAPTTFDWYLHTPKTPYEIRSQHDIRAVAKRSCAKVDFLWPEGLAISQTSKTDPPIGVGRKLVQHHLLAQTQVPATNQIFVTLITPGRTKEKKLPPPVLRGKGEGLVVEVPLSDGTTWKVDVKGPFEPVLETDWQAKIDAVAAKGGGRVVIPAGRHVTKGLMLKSNVELHLEKGAILEGSPRIKDYPVVELPYSEGKWMAVVMAVGATNVSVTGFGEIYGNGTAFPQPERYGNNQEGLRPRGLFFGNCVRVRLKNFTLRDAGCWGCVFQCCRNVWARRLTIDNHANANNDGIDLEAHNAIIEDCDIDSGDDGVCLKSNNPNFVSGNILVSNVTVRSHCAALKIGTASHGTITNVLFANCRIEAPRRDFPDRRANVRKPIGAGWFWNTGRAKAFPPSKAGDMAGLSAIALECVDGGRVEHITCRDITIDGMLSGIFVRGGTRQKRANGTPPGKQYVFRDILLENIRGHVLSWIGNSVTGVKGCRVKDVTMRDVNLTFPGGGLTAAKAVKPLPEQAEFTPGVHMFNGIYPAYALWARHVDGLRLENYSVRPESGTTDRRERLVFDDVSTD